MEKIKVLTGRFLDPAVKPRDDGGEVLRHDKGVPLRHPREGGDPVIPSLVWIPAFAGTGRRVLNVPNSSVNAIVIERI